MRCITLKGEKPLKLEKWRAKYGALIIALSCLGSVIISLGNNWVLTSILGFGVLVCGIIGILDIRRDIRLKKCKQSS